MTEPLFAFIQALQGVAQAGPRGSSADMPWMLIFIAIGIVTWLMFRKSGAPRGSAPPADDKDIDA